MDNKSKYKKCMIIDIIVIVCGVLGIITGIVYGMLGLQGNIEFDLTYLMFLPIGIFFTVYGAMLMQRDKKKYGPK